MAQQSLKSLHVIGLNSGTSMDGIDAALFRIGPKSGGTADTALSIEMLAGNLHPFEPTFQKQLKRMVARGHASLNEICRLDSALAEIFAQSAQTLLRKANLSAKSVDLIGSHGQTIWHAPDRKKLWGISTTGTTQLGNASFIAARTGIPVVSDFRTKDMAYGGQGAPLVAFADQVLFGADGMATGVLNIGGIANITIVSGKGQAVCAFDTGPGNMILDKAAQALFQKDFDTGGQLAAKGIINQPLLDELLAHPYFKKSPPKTTGREDFGEQYADKLLSGMLNLKLAPYDVMSTLTALTAASIAQGYKDFIAPKTPIERLILGGGGAENQTLKEYLLRFWPHPVKIYRHDDFGISTKFKEALLFALLAYTTYFGIPNNVPICTGATRHVSLGQICHP